MGKLNLLVTVSSKYLKFSCYMADEKLTEALEKLIQNTSSLSKIVCNFESSSQPVLNSTINNIVIGLKEVDELKSSFNEPKHQLPTEVFNYIDQGKNPSLYTKDCVKNSLQKNEEGKGKIELFKQFSESLLKQAESVYPQEISEYKKSRNNGF